MTHEQKQIQWLSEKLVSAYKLIADKAELQAEVNKTFDRQMVSLSAQVSEMSNKLINASNTIEELRYQLDKLKPAGYND